TRARKWTADSAKIMLALRGMLGRLRVLVEHDKITIKALQVVGLINAGESLQIMRVGPLGVNVGWLEMGRVRDVPCKMSMLRGVFDIMRSVIIFKEIVRDTVSVVTKYRGRSRAFTKQELLKEFMASHEL
ncbi:hypothetical protein RUND412_010529, partial [Rhizina undulata]